ncbi:MAG: radical SAM protein [Candidatus Omnitrophica bacterium]|nr:radical SAM protein [Candidatus Omnitrophota bacterium]
MKKNRQKNYILNSLYINPTGRCNLKCRHCWINPYYSNDTGASGNELKPGEIISIIKEARELGLANIKLTGGEPLLRNDLEEVFEFCAKNGIKICIETNGTLIDRGKALLLKKYNVDFISLSLDGCNPSINDSFRGVKGAFRMATDGIRNLVKAGFNPQVITCLHRRNVENFEKLAGLCKDLGVSSLKINPVMPVGKGKRLIKDKQNLGVKEILHFKNHILPGIRNKFQYDIFIHLPPAFLSLKEIGKRGKCNIFGILGVLPDGNISICGIGFHVDELLFGKPLRDRGGLKRIWRENKKLNELRKHVPDRLEGVCSKCIFKKICLGCCRAEVYYRDKNFYAPFWFCQESYKQGLFPESRLIPSTSDKGMPKRKIKQE